MKKRKYYRAIMKITGTILLLLAVSMIPSVLCAIRYHEPRMLHGLAISILITAGVGFVLFRTTKLTAGTIFRPREGYLTVAICWLVVSLFGTLPYFLSGFTTSFIDALFDSVAGFTTTGCTCFPVETVPKSLLLCKSTYNWLGGMGILIFIISVFPALGINGQVIARIETPSPTLEKTAIRMTNTAKYLYLVYISFTLIEFCLLNFSRKMDTFDALINSLTNISTAGFFCHSEGLSYYNSLYVEIVFCIFSMLGAINFILFSYLVKGKFRLALKDRELHTFLLIILFAGAICSVSLFKTGNHDFPNSVRYGFEHVISFITTSGFSVADYHVWPAVCQITLFSLLFIGGCSSSTSGGIKVVRIIVMMKYIRRGMYKRLHPRSVLAVKIGENVIPPTVLSSIAVFVISYLGFFLLSCFVLAFQGMDLHHTISAAAGMLSNSGIFLDSKGQIFCDYQSFSPFIKLWLGLTMIVGRLELFTVIILFTRSFWKKNSQ